MLTEKDNFSIAFMARRLKVSRSGFYSWLQKDKAPNQWDDLYPTIKHIWEKSSRRFGARFIKCFLPNQYAHISLYRVRKCMKELGIKGCTPYKSKRTTIPDKRAKQRPDLICRDFTSPVPTYKLVGDITYLRTKQGWLYLSVVIDLNTRMVVGWSLSNHMTADIVVNALKNAKARGYIADNAIFHSDRGSQYTSRLLADWAHNNSVRLSCGRTGSCHDNAVAESFFATLKNEMYYQTSFATRTQAKQAIIEFIEVYYNRNRPHSSVGYRIPAELMDSFFERTQANCKKVDLAA